MASEFRSNVPLLSQATVNGLHKAIVHYQAIVDAGGWAQIPNDTWRRGDRGEAVDLLRRRLALTGDLDPEAGRPWLFDDALKVAIARFQSRHGLPVTGMVDRHTLFTLNVSAEDRLRQLRRNLARLAELDEAARAERFVLVNTASFEMEAIEDGAVALRSRVVVGRPEADRQTPALSTRIIELNFFPYWRVPESITRRDLIPQLRKDPDYLSRERFSVMKAWGTKPLDPANVDWSSPQVRDLKFRQDPGPFNALGVVRLNMPNKHIVYLHDTPLKRLFDRNARAYSAGCVRVEKVLDLAAWLLRDDPDWNLARVEAAVEKGASFDVKLRKAVPVHLTYVSAWASENGVAHFRPDIYGRDGTKEVVAMGEGDPQTTSITP